MNTAAVCLATALFFEARSEGVDGMEAVASVIVNRVEHSSYPDTVCGVVNQHKQFSYTHDGLSDDPLVYDTYHDALAWELVKEVATEVLDSGPINPHIVMYHATYVTPYWASSYEVSGMVGSHIFYQTAD